MFNVTKKKKRLPTSEAHTHLLLPTPPHNTCSTNLELLTVVDHLLTEHRQLVHQNALIVHCRPLRHQAVHLLLLCHNFLKTLKKRKEKHRLHHAFKSSKTEFSPESKLEKSKAFEVITH